MLKIKNIQQYRTYFKEEVRQSPNRDEHLLSNFYLDRKTGKKSFGWFDLFHGQKGSEGELPERGIRKFLMSFLNMAKDRQAVYEFLQNAVDEDSTHFSMIWGTDEVDGQDYLLVANNGEMFSTDDVESILNIGASTKTFDSQNIGKYGIGFKLAHRLVGKDDGLNELIRDYTGPVIFSWKNNEIKDLASPETILTKPIDFNEEEVSSDPWLFKILLTCFPCLPENEWVPEFPRLLNGEPTPKALFPKEEVAALSRWTAKLMQKTGEYSYEKGSLFFMRLGEGKAAQLQDENLSEGVKFSMGLLSEMTQKNGGKGKELQQVQLNDDEAIQMPELKYENFKIEEEDPEYENIYGDEKEKKEGAKSYVEYIIGFKSYNEIEGFFEGAPNFYLYFPLSEEVHQLNFILHCSAFDNSSSRVFLQEGGNGRNEQLFKTLVGRVEERMRDWAEKDPTRFLDLYAAFLSSGQSENENRQWVNHAFLKPLNKMLQSIVPVRTSLLKDSFWLKNIKSKYDIRFKDTQIDIDLENWVLHNIRWFYWDKEHYPDFTFKAQEKLEIKPFSLFNLLKVKGAAEKINAWLEEKIEGKPDRIEIVLEELDKEFIAKWIKEIKENLFDLKILEFTNGEVLSFNELADKQSEGYFIMHNKLADVKNILIKAGFKTTKLDFNKFDFINTISNHLGADSQLRGHTELVRLFSDSIDESIIIQLSVEEKHKIYEAFKNLNEQDRHKRMRELKLFKNKAGKIVPLKNLLKETSISWLKQYCIDPNEFKPKMVYFQDEPGLMYSHIIFPFWTDISSIISEDLNEAISIVKEIKNFYNAATDKEELSEIKQVFFKGELRDNKSVYYHSQLINFVPEQYMALQSLLYTHFQLVLPDQWYLQFLKEAPFSQVSADLNFLTHTIQIKREELLLLLDFCSKVEVNLFNHRLIREEEGVFYLEELKELSNCFSTNEKLITYIQKYHLSDFVPLPESLKGIHKKPEMSGDTLIEELIERYDETLTQEERKLDLTAALLQEKDEQQNLWFQKVKEVIVDINWENEKANSYYLKWLANLFDLLDSDKREMIFKKLILQDGTAQIRMESIHQASENLILKKEEKEYQISLSLLLNRKDQHQGQQVRGFASKCVQENYFNQYQADTIFKLGEAEKPPLYDFTVALRDQKLENADQLAFTLLYEELDQSTLSQYQIQAKNEEWYPLQGNWFFSDSSDQNLLHSKNVLHQRYTNLRNILNQNDFSGFQYGNPSENLILGQFLFEEEATPEVFSTQNNTISILDYLHASWKRNHPNNHSKKEANWQAAFGFNTNRYVYSDYAVGKEEISDEIKVWINEEDSRKQLLEGIGFQTDTSEVVEIRKALVDQNHHFQLEKLSLLPNHLLIQSLKGLIKGFNGLLHLSFPIVFQKEDPRIELIFNIQQVLAKDQDVDYPVLVHQANNCFKLIDPLKDHPYFFNSQLREDLEAIDDHHLDELYQKSLILAFNKELESAYSAEYQHLSTVSNFLSGNSVEEEEPFYEEWSKKHQLRLYRSKALLFEIVAELPAEKMALGILFQQKWCALEAEDGFQEIHYAYQQLTFHLLQEEMEKAADLNGKAIAEFDAQRKSARKALDSFDSKELKKIMQKSHNETLRKDFLCQMNGEPKYSHGWFMAYMGYLNTYNELESSTKRKSLFFQQVEKYITSEGKQSLKSLYLKGAGQPISDSIEHFEDFEIHFQYRDKTKKKIKVASVTKKGEDLLVYSRTELPHEFIHDLVDIQKAEIRFTPILDLFNRLKTTFSNKSYIKIWNHPEENLPELHFIYGPPGTGKTTELKKRICGAIAENNAARILVLTPTNKAADVITQKVLEAQPDTEIYRIGSDPSGEMEQYEDLYHASVDQDLIDKANVLVSTIHRLPYFTVQTESESVKLFELYDGKHWDYIIFDEASMINLPYMVFALRALYLFHPNAQFIVAGDPKQLPPVEAMSDADLEEMEIVDENIYKMLGINSFEEVYATNTIPNSRHTIDTLHKQYRSIDQIGDLYSHFSYGGKLEHCRHLTDKKTPRPLPGDFAKWFKKQVSFIPFPVGNDNSVFKPHKLGYSSFHIYSVLLAFETVLYFDKCLIDEDQRDWTIGLISPYKAQNMLIHKLITSGKISNRLKVVSNTVHGFQGDECDIILFTANPNNVKFTGHAKSLLSKEYLYNVAISRARDYLWVMYPQYENQQNHFITQLKDIHEEQFGEAEIIHASVLEKNIFKQSDFIDRNCHVSGHDDINIFGLEDLEYFIKTNDRTIDVQLRKLNR